MWMMIELPNVDAANKTTYAEDIRPGISWISVVTASTVSFPVINKVEKYLWYMLIIWLSDLDNCGEYDINATDTEINAAVSDTFMKNLFSTSVAKGLKQGLPYSFSWRIFDRVGKRLCMSLCQQGPTFGNIEHGTDESLLYKYILYARRNKWTLNRESNYKHEIITCTWNITTSVKNRLNVEATAICTKRQVHLTHKKPFTYYLKLKVRPGLKLCYNQKPRLWASKLNITTCSQLASAPKHESTPLKVYLVR